MVFIGMLALLGILVCFAGTIFMAVKKNPAWRKFILAGIGCSVLFVTAMALNDPTKDTTQPVNALTIEQQLEKLVKDSTGTDFRKIDSRTIDGAIDLTEIHINGKDNLTTAMTRKGVNIQAADLFEKIYTSGIPIKEATIIVYLPLVDKYGNTSDVNVLKITLKAVTEAKINWQGVNKLEFNKVADSAWMHPSLMD